MPMGIYKYIGIRIERKRLYSAHYHIMSVYFEMKGLDRRKKEIFRDSNGDYIVGTVLRYGSRGACVSVPNTWQGKLARVYLTSEAPSSSTKKR